MLETINRAKQTLEKLKKSSNSENVFFSFILDKCLYQTELAFQREEKSLNELCAVTRFNLEALIDMRLCEQNECYTLAMEFNQKQTFINLYKIQLEQYQQEIAILNEYQNKESEMSGSLTGELFQKKSPQAEDIKKFHENRIEKEKQLDEDFLDEAIYFTPPRVFSDGYGFTASMIEKKVLPQIRDRINQLLKEQREIAKKAKNDFFHQFAFALSSEMQDSKAASLIEIPQESWQKKASEANLSNEYKFIYRYTSSIIHCVGLAYLSKKDVDENDVNILETASKRYIRIMTKILEQRLKPDDIKLFQKNDSST
jgi:hypothetical protein